MRRLSVPAAALLALRAGMAATQPAAAGPIPAG